MSVWNFIKEHGEQLQADPRAKTAISRHAWVGELTEHEADAAYHVAAVYAAWERDHRRRRVTRTAAFERAYGSADAAEERLSPDELKQREARETQAERDIRKVWKCFRVVPPANVAGVRAVVEKLCAEDKPLDWIERQRARPMLEYIWQSILKRGGESDKLPSIAITASRPRRKAPTPRQVVRRAELVRDAWEQVERQHHPELSPEDLNKKWRQFEETRDALRDRERFRRETARRRR